MAHKDMSQGWGDIPRALTRWYCPKCAVDYPIADWQIAAGSVNGHACEGRKCPTCDFCAYQNHESLLMVPPPPKVEPPKNAKKKAAPKKAAARKPPKKAANGK